MIMQGYDQEVINKIEKIANEVMQYSRNVLLVNMRYLDVALNKLELVSSDLFYLATDGKRLAYNPLTIIQRYKEEREVSVRDYLHVILHCVFCHMFIHTMLNQKAWDLACDIAVENIISDFKLPCVSAKREIFQKEQIYSLNGKVKYMTAESLYRFFCDGNYSDEELESIRAAFAADNHTLWHLPPSQNPLMQSEKSNSNDPNASPDFSNGSDNTQNHGENETDNTQSESVSLSEEQEWKELSNRVKEDLSTFSKRRGTDAGSMMQNLAELHREKYDYTSFLKKFAVIGEVMKINDAEFDYIMYTYGLRIYGKMPLIEPLEYKEEKRIKEFVIAIDTSGSVSGELVRSFLQKTYNILKQEETFFRKINLHIIQCDAEIQEDIKITSQKDFDR
jgi:predicted metal-dependent peptidase